jgi:DNA-binding MarR family transcriptional regulator
MATKRADRTTALTAERVVSVGLLLSKVATVVDRRLAAALDAMELRPKHLGALSVLCAHGALSQQALGERLGVDASAVVAIVDDLERDGLARRDRDPGDRRRHAVQVTAAGRTTLSRGHQTVGQVDDELFAGLTGRERQQLLTLLLRTAESDPDLVRLIGAGAIAAPAP